MTQFCRVNEYRLGRVKIIGQRLLSFALGDPEELKRIPQFQKHDFSSKTLNFFAKYQKGRNFCAN